MLTLKYVVFFVFLCLSNASFFRKCVSCSTKNRLTSLIGALTIAVNLHSCQPVHAAIDLGGNDTTNTKIKAGGASTLQQGISKAITRGVNLDKSVNLSINFEDFNNSV